jgi:hypothetical protein
MDRRRTIKDRSRRDRDTRSHPNVPRSKPVNQETREYEAALERGDLDAAARVLIHLLDYREVSDHE